MAGPLRAELEELPLGGSATLCSQWISGWPNNRTLVDAFSVAKARGHCGGRLTAKGRGGRRERAGESGELVRVVSAHGPWKLPVIGL